MPAGDAGAGDLAARLRSSDVDERRAAARSCYQEAESGRNLTWSTVRALAGAAADPDRPTGVYARGALTELSGEWSDESDRVTDLVEEIADGATGGRERAALLRFLARAHRTSVFDAGTALDAALGREDPAVRRSLATAVYASAQYPGTAVRDHVDALLPLLSDPDPAVRAPVTAALGHAAGGSDPEPRCVAAVVDRLDDPDPRVRREAARPLHGETVQYDLDPDLRDRVLEEYVEGSVGCFVDLDPKVREEAEPLVAADVVREHDEWRDVVLPELVDAFADGRGSEARPLLERLAAAAPDAVAPHVGTMLDASVSAEDRRAAAQIATAYLGTETFPAEEAVPALLTAVDDRADARGALTALTAVAEHHPEQLVESLPTLLRALADGDRKVRAAATDVLAALAEAAPETVPEPVRALSDADSLTALVDDHPQFVAERVRELVAIAADDPDRTDELYWRWWHPDAVAADSSVLDAAVPLLAELLTAERERRAVAGEFLQWVDEPAAMASLTDELQQAIADGPAELPVDVLQTAERVTTGQTALPAPLLDDVAAWLTWHEGRSTAARMLAAAAERGADRPPVADLPVDHEDWTEEPLAALAATDSARAAEALFGIVDRYCEGGTGQSRAVVGSIVAVHGTDQDLAERAVRRLDDRLDHYGRRLDASESFLNRVGDGRDGLAGAGLGLLLTALDYSRGSFRRQVPDVLERAATARPAAAVAHADGVADRLSDGFESVREAASELLVIAGREDPAAVAQVLGAPLVGANERGRAAARETLPAVLATASDSTDIQPLVSPVRTHARTVAGRLASGDDADGSGADPGETLSVLRSLHDAFPGLAGDVVAPLALDATLEVAGGFDALSPTDLLAPLGRVLADVPELVEESPKQLAFGDVTVVFTGTVGGTTRSELRDAVEQQGGRSTSSVSGRTDLLVVGDDPGTAKREDALEAGVPMVQGDAFHRFLDERL